MRTVTALIADDVPAMRDLLKSSLKVLGVEAVAQAEQGGEVLALIKQHAPDIVFLDINMPGRDGLSLLREIMQQRLHGFVVIISGESELSTIQQALDVGARGYIVKPYSMGKLKQIIAEFRESSAPHLATKAAPVKQAQPPLQVVLADDESHVAANAEQAFADLGRAAVVQRAADGEQALAMLTDAAAPVDVVFLDIAMPVLSGFEALRRIRAMGNHTFVVMISAAGTMENIKCAIDQGANAFMVKPFSADKLRQALASLLSRR